MKRKRQKIHEIQGSDFDPNLEDEILIRGEDGKMHPLEVPDDDEND